MAHVKCKYTKYECRECKDKNDTGCETLCSECNSLDHSYCFLEVTRKNVDYDGHWLTISGKPIALADWDCTDPIAGVSYIDELEIDGERYIPESEPQKSESEIDNEGWEMI